MTNTFWSNEPSILFNKDEIIKIYPTTNMSLDEQLNAISRMVILLCILGFLFTMNINYLLIGIITMAMIWLFYKVYKNKSIENFNINQINVTSDNYNNQNKYITNPVTLETVLKNNYCPTTKKNPMGNVLLTDIMDNPNKNPAAPSFNPDVYEDITRASKNTVQYLNPGIKNTNKQLFGDLAQNYEFDFSMRNFYSMPNTRITNDQGAYAEYLYGNMPSCKDGNAFACVQDNLRYILI